MTDQTQHTFSSSENQNAGKLGYLFSWMFFALASCVFLFGCYVAYDVVMSAPKANILVNNKALSAKRQLQLQGQLQNAVQGNFFTADLTHIQEQVSGIDWVKSVKVSRKWPNGISINVFPRHAVARFGSERLISSDGHIFSGEDLRSASYENLPLLFGPKAQTSEIMRQYFQVNQWFENTQLRLVELSVSDQMTWFLKFNNGLRVIVDKDQSEKKLFRLSVLLTKQLLPVGKQIEAIDLRYRNGMAISWKNGEPANLRNLLNISLKL